jgi:hypothetical protein
MQTNNRNRFESLPKRTFRTAIIRLLETEYKLLGSHKVLQMVADDIIELHKSFYPDIEQNGFGSILWHTTGANCSKPSYGTKVEDYEIKTVILPLVTKEDIEARINMHYGRSEPGVSGQVKQRERDIATMARLIKSAYKQGGLLSGAELSVLMNRSLTVIGQYLKHYHETHDDILPTKGIVLDQGSKPTHKASIINLYEQGYPEVDIARLTNHTIDSTSRYIKTYKKVKLLLEKRFSIQEIIRVTGMGKSTVVQYRDLVFFYHSELNPAKSQGKGG